MSIHSPQLTHLHRTGEAAEEAAKRARLDGALPVPGAAVGGFPGVVPPIGVPGAVPLGAPPTGIPTVPAGAPLGLPPGFQPPMGLPPGFKPPEAASSASATTSTAGAAGASGATSGSTYLVYSDEDVQMVCDNLQISICIFVFLVRFSHF